MSPTKLTIDIDLTEEDQRRDPIEVTLPGLGTYEFPGVLNALATVRVARWSALGRADADELTGAEVVALLGDLVPDEVLTDWSRKGFDIFAPDNLPRLEKIIEGLLAEYQRRAEARGEDLSGKARTARPQGPTTPPPFTGTGPT